MLTAVYFHLGAESTYGYDKASKVKLNHAFVNSFNSGMKFIFLWNEVLPKLFILRNHDFLANLTSNLTDAKKVLYFDCFVFSVSVYSLLTLVVT